MIKNTCFLIALLLFGSAKAGETNKNTNEEKPPSFQVNIKSNTLLTGSWLLVTGTEQNSHHAYGDNYLQQKILFTNENPMGKWVVIKDSMGTYTSTISTKNFYPL